MNWGYTDVGFYSLSAAISIQKSMMRQRKLKVLLRTCLLIYCLKSVIKICSNFFVLYRILEFLNWDYCRAQSKCFSFSLFVFVNIWIYLLDLINFQIFQSVNWCVRDTPHITEWQFWVRCMAGVSWGKFIRLKSWCVQLWNFGKDNRINFDINGW